MRAAVYRHNSMSDSSLDERRYLSDLDPEMIDKEIIRKWIKNNYDPYDKTITIEVSKEMQELVMKRYIQLYEIITRQPLEMCF